MSLAEPYWVWLSECKSGKYEPFLIQLILLLFVHPHGPWMVSVLDDCGQHHWQREPQCQGQEFSVSGCVADCQLIEGMTSNLLESNSSLILSLKKATGDSFDSYNQYFECYAKHFLGHVASFLVTVWWEGWGNGPKTSGSIGFLLSRCVWPCLSWVWGVVNGTAEEHWWKHFPRAISGCLICPH